MEDDRSEERPAETSILGCLVPTFWMLVGNGILACCAITIAVGETTSFCAADVLYWTTVGCLVAARYADIRYLSGRTSDGQPATMAHWRRYTTILVVVSLAVWIAAHLIPNVGL